MYIIEELPAVAIFLAILILISACFRTQEIFSRILLYNGVSSLIMGFIIYLTYAQNNYSLLDIIMIYALTSFTSIIGFLKYYHKVKDHE